jgi:hypothetical protein
LIALPVQTGEAPPCARLAQTSGRRKRRAWLSNACRGDYVFSSFFAESRADTGSVSLIISGIYLSFELCLSQIKQAI